MEKQVMQKKKKTSIYGQGTMPIALMVLIYQATAEVDITQKSGTYTFWYNSSNTEVATYKIDFCTIAPCVNKHYAWKCDQYGTRNTPTEAYICVTSKYWGNKCAYWGSVGWNSGHSYGYQPKEAFSSKDKHGESLLTRLTLYRQNRCDSKFMLSIKHPQSTDAGTYVLGESFFINPSLTQFLLQDMFNNEKYAQLKSPKPRPNLLKPHIATFKDMIAINNPTLEDTLAIETGFSDINFWLEWMKYSANKHNKSNCYVCGRSRPHLGTVPLNIPLEQESCFFSLYNGTKINDSQCEMWKKEYPILSKNPNLGNTITIYPGNYTCYNSTSHSGKDFKNFPPGYCSETRNTILVNQTKSLGDIYYICGDLKLRTRLNIPWKGQCALAKIIMPLHILPTNEGSPTSNTAPTHRRKRETPIGSFDPHVYIDTIGVPRGVPDEFKARDEVAAGFESLIPIITANKNVAWINYIYYNQQRFINDTKVALKGIAEQLEATSQMTFQNRMALDMILAEKGGVCVYIKQVEGCCTFIPDNTGPNGKVTLAIKKLDDLSIELKKNSGIDNPWSQYFGWFENWKQGLVQLGIYILIVIAIFCVVFFCIIPCCRKLATKGIENSLMYEAVFTIPPNSPAAYKQYLTEYRNKKLHVQNHVI
ncbi:mitochondrial protein C2orf69 homolog isoform X1 [Pseudophryne corroboree]|uniref:mitochondrial protein C2orf69 homolog isoform X1 n=1 Tax=Pseudophryne corroboree TaxID=495146 RepID=UPI003082045E